MTPLWFPWTIVGGLVFLILGFIGTKYKDKLYAPVQSLQDFISGSILVAFTGVLMPDLFPPMELPAMGAQVGSDDVDLQVGPPRLIRG
jgi:hypothetical protein